MLIELIDDGQFIQAIETHVRAVKVPIPCEIINDGGIIMAKGLIPKKLIFEAWAINRRPTIKSTCREFIMGFSFLETKIKIPQ